MSVSRRGFFLKLGRGLVEDVLGPVNVSYGRCPPAASAEDGAWVEIGSMREHRAGTSREFGHLGVRAESTLEGLVVRDSVGSVKPVRIDRFGKIWVNLKESWPENAVLSWATGELQSKEEA